MTALLWVGALTCAEAARSVDQKICREITQGYEQIKAGANTLQVNRVLFSATRRGCEDLAKRLLAEGASLQARDRSGAMPLSRAAEEGWIALVTLFLDRGAPINSRDVYGSTALFRAAEADRLEIVRMLLDRGADVHIRGRKGNSVIAAAAYMGTPEMVEVLLKGGADPMLVDQFGKSPMSYAAGRGFTDVVRVLLDGGIDVNARYGNDLTALMWAAGHSADAGYLDALEVMNLLISRGARIDDRDDRGRTALMMAAELGHDEVVEALLDHGADVSLVDNDGKSASEFASTDVLRARLTSSN
ncbi:MAG: ankyrin repeat domain-containing protein [Hyphomicrobium sp.]